MAEISTKPKIENGVPSQPPGYERRPSRRLGRPSYLRPFDIPRMRHAPLTRRRNRRRFHLPFRFCDWITSESVSLSPPDEFIDVYLDNRCLNSKFIFRETGEIFPVSVEVDENGRPVFAGGFPDFVYAIGVQGEARLDFSYMGKGVFEVKIGGDCEEVVLMKIDFDDGDWHGGMSGKATLEEDESENINSVHFQFQCTRALTYSAVQMYGDDNTLDP